ncbi:hypothetical protein [Cellvibrio mixtus]|uniref:hypothetical protein n=1 Tax=Cellvibrio mixtus TaxID=39650 RepID=UPI000586FA42|nr:hypothetical protein [Cellvibrio mixtus]
MKLITSEYIQGNIADSVALLRSKGILVSSTNDYANIPRYGHAARAIKQGIWVHLSNQYSDAMLLLKNPNAVIQSGLSDEQMEAIESEAKAAFYNSSSVFFSRVATVILCMGLIVLLSYVALSVYKA